MEVPEILKLSFCRPSSSPPYAQLWCQVSPVLSPSVLLCPSKISREDTEGRAWCWWKSLKIYVPQKKKKRNEKKKKNTFSLIFIRNYYCITEVKSMVKVMVVVGGKTRQLCCYYCNKDVLVESCIHNIRMIIYDYFLFPLNKVACAAPACKFRHV